MSLYQAVRPTKLEDVIGNTSAIANCKRILSKSPEDRPHVLLFVGESGCGKTTLARIMAKGFGCIDPIEKNAAAKGERGIDMAADLAEFARFSPMGGGPRVVIIDECQQLTSAAQGALLKTLEDIQPFNYYILCTTDPHKLLKTIITRCDKIEVKRLTDPWIIDVLEDAISFAELENVSNDILSDIATRAEGCPRSALVLLEKIVGLSDDEAYEILGNYAAGNKHVIDICRAIVDGKKTWSDISSLYNKIPEEEKAPEAIRLAIVGYLKSCLLKAKGTASGRFANMLEEMMAHTYHDGEPKLLVCIYRAWETGKG